MFDETGCAEKLATLVHQYKEALAPDFGLSSSKYPGWSDLAQEERHRLVAAMSLALLDLRHSAQPQGSGAGASFTGFPASGSEGRECGC